MENKSALTLPKLRFKGFDGEWKNKKLGDISLIRTGTKYLKDKSDDGLYPFFVRSEKVERINTYSFDGEAILIPTDGKIGEIYHYIKGKFDYHQKVYKISNSHNNLKFIYFLFQKNIKKYIFTFSDKATVESIRLPMLMNFPVSLPSLQEQQKIAHFFSLVDKQIKLWERKLELYELIYEYLLKKLFPNKKLRNKNTSKVKIKNILTEYSTKTDYLKIPLYSVGKQGVIPREKIFSEKIIYKDDYKVKVAYPNVAIIGMGSKQIDFKVNFFNHNIGISSAYRTFCINENFNPMYIEKFFERNIDYFSSLYMVISARQGKTTDIENFLEDYIEIWENISQKEVIQKINIVKKIIELASFLVKKLVLNKKYYLKSLFV